jgi:hypothetical protein
MFDVEFYNPESRQWEHYNTYPNREQAEHAIAMAVKYDSPSYSNLSGRKPKSNWRLMPST